jgi:hypothetical protein
MSGDIKFHIYNMVGDSGFSERWSKLYAAEIIQMAFIQV